LGCGAILSEAERKTAHALSKYVKALGLVVQITEDILNVVGDSQKMGKAIKTDASHHKGTFPELLWVEAARAYARKYSSQAKEAISGLGNSAWVLKELADYVVERQS